MNNLVCEHPSIIMNPHLRDAVLLHANYTFRGESVELTPSIVARYYHTFPYSLFGTRKQGITHADLDNCYILDKATGDCIPMYYEVPCGKCILCRDKKAREWSTRAMCEAQYSQGYPLFVTLTYDNVHLPKDGVQKKHAQNFMKRLRINLNRYMGRDINLRFFLCAEYGSKSKRPHYHALIYNFPQLDTLKRTLSIIEKSWSFVIPRGKVGDVGGIVFKDEHSNRYRQQYGFVHLRQAQGGHVKYCMKYMRKDAPIPHGSNDVFYLSSRRRGLGYQWLHDHYDEFLQHPQLGDVVFTDIWSCAKFEAAMPTYFKNILYPTISRIIPKKIRDDFGLFVHYLTVRHSILQTDFITKNEKDILQKYAPLANFIPQVLDETYVRTLRNELKTDFTSYIPYKLPFYDKKFKAPRMGLVLVNALPISAPPEDDDINEILLDHVTEELSILSERLKTYSYDSSFFYDAAKRKNIRLYYLTQQMDANPAPDIQTMAIEVHQRRQRQLQNEYF